MLFSSSFLSLVLMLLATCCYGLYFLIPSLLFLCFALFCPTLYPCPPPLALYRSFLDPLPLLHDPFSILVRDAFLASRGSLLFSFWSLYHLFSLHPKTLKKVVLSSYFSFLLLNCCFLSFSLWIKLGSLIIKYVLYHSLLIGLCREGRSDNCSSDALHWLLHQDLQVEELKPV